jgi:hypothetical protein
VCVPVSRSLAGDELYYLDAGTQVVQLPCIMFVDFFFLSFSVYGGAVALLSTFVILCVLGLFFFFFFFSPFPFPWSTAYIVLCMCTGFWWC